jgi:1-acyl-sn-glycerol-3-phosphate acyltransferase
MNTGYFDSETYATPEKSLLSLIERLRLNNRLYFTLKYVALVFSTRREALDGRYDTKAWADSSFYILRLIEKTGGKFHIEGIENIGKSGGPVVFISNHMSTLETMVFPGIIAPIRNVTFVVKDSLVKHPLFGAVMRSRDPIVVGRTDPRKDFETVMNEGVELLSKGISVVIFPQSTRSPVFKMEEFNSLGIKLARKAGVDVVPVAIRTDFWGNGSIVKDLGPIDRYKPVNMVFGEPFRITGNGREEHLKVVNFIKSYLLKWGCKIQDNDSGIDI